MRSRHATDPVGRAIDEMLAIHAVLRFAHLPPPIRWARRPLYRRYTRTLAALGTDAQASRAP